MVKKEKFQRAPLVLAVAAASTLGTGAFAQDAELIENSAGPAPQVSAPAIEEVMVQGRLRDSAEMLINERLDEEVVTDVLGSEMIGRVGDSTVAAALRRVSGLTLVSEKFVYVRGLGERYSNTTLNGATVPSPDLTRNVIPLDIFPTSVVESLAVQKTYSADQAATFGGGNVDIRTKGIPEQLTYSLEIGSGFNSETKGDVLSYNGGSDDDFGTDDGTRAMSREIDRALERFNGSLGVQNIRATLIKEGNVYGSAHEATAAAAALNRELALNLNRDIAIEEDSSQPDYDVKGSVGNQFYFGDNWQVGFLAGASYKNQLREENKLKRSYGFPDERIDTENKSIYSVDLTGNLNVGVNFADEHDVSATSLYLRNTDDSTAVRDYFNENGEVSSGHGFREYSLKYEERDMVVNQVKGSHSIGPESKRLLPLVGWVPEDIRVDWFYTDARAATDIPNEVNISAITDADPVTGEVLDSQVSGAAGPSASYRFTKLEDEVINYGWSATLPLEFSSSSLELSGGVARTEKGRSYKETNLVLEQDADSSILQGALDDVFSDEHISDAENDFVLGVAGNNRSYLAATLTDAVFGKVDWTLNETWRVSAGARWEDYNQVAIKWNPYGNTVDNPQVNVNDPDAIRSFSEDKIYPSLSLTYMGNLWAETFQLRLGASKTAVRPDLREITDAIYIDPITGERISGNPNTRPSEITNLDVRAEWFFDSGDNLTVSLFNKDIQDPIEFFERASSDTNISREIVNAESGVIRGIEFEGLKSLGFMGETMDAFFVQGNVTLQDSELIAGDEADAPTNPEREMTEASEYVVNMLVGFDSPDGDHSATLGYNVFGERLYIAGRNGAPDGFEQPFHSLDLTYSWYPTQEITLKAKVQNLLDETIEIERAGVIVFEEKPGQTFALSAQYKF
ncbi:TonB-dependent receptor [Microbulbifer donghaiensis]|uniref:TonB-dependent receptor n=1 Tax=Microbulbifer donghaiensis TaxID=494016 RepID=A0A1M4UED8_9GAMM|nr:TonB-dependent receptor [Microbulbifer donghaiensis]